MRNHLIIGGLILGLEAWLGIGLFGSGVGVVCAIVFAILAIAEKQRQGGTVPQRCYLWTVAHRDTGLDFCECKTRTAQSHPVISAVNSYRSGHGEYPRALSSLFPSTCPRFLTPVSPRVSRISVLQRQAANFTSLECFMACFAYDFPTESRTTNE